MARKQQLSRRMCIFCGERPANSKEHFYSSWMGEIVHTPLDYYIDHVRPMTRNRPGVQSIKKRAGRITTIKHRVVCTECNNGWMSRAEAAARPLLERMIGGMGVSLDEDSTYTIVRWIAIKTIVSEHKNRDDFVTPSEIRQKLAQGILPNKFNIYLFTHTSADSTGYHRFATELHLISPGDKSDPKLLVRGKNTQQITFVIGRMLVHVVSTTQDDFIIEEYCGFPKQAIAGRLYPHFVMPFEWPLIELDDASIARLASGLEYRIRNHTGPWMN